MIPPGHWLGMLGGGQLGRMFTHAAQALGYRILVLDPDPHSPAGAVADRHLQAKYDDSEALDELARSCAAVTTEFENVPAGALDRLARAIPARPSANAVRIAQDRELEKSFLADNGFAVAPFRVLKCAADCADIPPGLLPGIVKTARLGYDGKGQVGVGTAADVTDAFRGLHGQPCVLEQRVPLALEVSVLVARSASDRTAVWPIAENRHRDGILDVSIVPARIPEALAAEARALGLRVAERLDYQGVLCVEMFVTTDGRLLINEIAPRPHNSGHWSIDGAFTSQFEQQCRVLAGLPLGDTTQHTPAVMINLLGDIWFDAPAAKATREPDWAGVLADPRAKLHLYGKREARRGRKMGHVTCLAGDVGAALAAGARVKRNLGIPEV
ncbi:MAG: 5-(carboxyamino)imidazole ribonucleotide synthase [Betaproteobacteria bacterium]|nr:5-(carboxyamino)imidazole ribonucleotide synthase [Betaproteobacteria bacterium]